MIPTMTWLVSTTALKWSIFITITSVTLPPLLHSFATSILFVTWSMDTIEKNYEHLHAVEHTRWEYDFISTQYTSPRPGGNAQDGGDVPPFHVPKLWTFDWAERMGLERPLRYRWSDWWRYHGGGEGMDKLGSADGLMWDTRKAGNADGRMPQMWVYVTENFYGGETGPQVMGRDWMSGNISFRKIEAKGAWDQAFVEVVRWYHEEANHDEDRSEESTNQNSSRRFFFVDSKESKFLMRVWGVKAPCLLHFVAHDVEEENQTIENQRGLWEAILDVLEGDSGEEHTYDAPAAYLRPVTVRAIDLPLDNTRRLFSDGRLRNEFEQLQKLIAEEGVWKLWPKFNARQEFFARFVEYWSELPGSKGTFFRYLRKTDGWSRKYLGQSVGLGKLQVELEGIGSMAGFLMAPLTILLLRWIRRVFEEYLGLSRSVQRPLAAG